MHKLMILKTLNSEIVKYVLKINTQNSSMIAICKIGRLLKVQALEWKINEISV